MKAIITLLFLGLFLVGGTHTQAQIFQTKNDILKDLGTPDDTGVSKDGSEYIVYQKDYNTEASGEYTRHKVIYFVELDDGAEVCNMWKILEPSTETNSNMSFFKDNFVEIGYMEFKDYENEILYDVKVEDGLCVVTASYNNTK